MRLFRKFHPSYLVVAWSLGVIVCTALSYFCVGLGDKFGDDMIGMEVTLSGSVMEDPGGDGSEVFLKLGNLEIQNQAVGGLLYVQLFTGESIRRSDTVEVFGKISEGFGIFAGSMWRPILKEIARPDPPDFALEVRDWFGGLVRRFIPEPQVDLSLGYLMGQKRSLPEDISELLNKIGLTYMVVASGYALSVIVGAIKRVFRKVSRFALLFFSLILVICFMGVTGFGASIVRAGIVTFFSMMAWYSGRKFHPGKLLLLVTAITLLINPNYIVDLGWLLSITSFAGIVMVRPILTAYFYGDKKPNFIAEVITGTMAAQMCCLPIILYFYGSFSIVGVIASVLILPTLPVVMALTFLTGCFAFLPVLASLMGWLASMLLNYHIELIKFFGDMDWAVLSMPEGNGLVFLGYLIILLVVIYMKRRTKFRLIARNVLELQ